MIVAKHIPLDELYSKEELQDLVKEFSIASGLKEYVNLVGFNSILFKMGFELSNDTIHEFIIKINEQYDPEIIEFECFARVVAILLEESARGDSQNNLHDYVYQEHDQRLHQIDEGFNQEMDM